MIPTDALTIICDSIQLQKPNQERRMVLGKTVGVWERKRRNIRFWIFYVFLVCCAVGGETTSILCLQMRTDSLLMLQSWVVHPEMLFFSLVLPTILQVCRKKLFPSLCWQWVLGYLRDAYPSRNSDAHTQVFLWPKHLAFGSVVTGYDFFHWVSWTPVCLPPHSVAEGHLELLILLPPSPLSAIIPTL